MNDKDREDYRRRYRERLARLGHDPRTLGWDKGKQPQRFAALTQLLPLERLDSVLDVGCGFGDLYPYLCAQGFAGRYTGVDFVPELLEVGREAYPGAEFISADFGELDDKDRYDIVVASGIFNARLSGEDHWTYLTATLRRMHALCRVCACADFLTSSVDFRREDLYYTPPEEVFRFGRTLTRRVALLHNYMPFEFALYLFKDDRVGDWAQFFQIPANEPNE
jgi:SAM-dependent methyltransferase